MTCRRSRLLAALTIAAGLLCTPSDASAQGVEIAPLFGYRFGGDFFEIISGQQLDLDGAAALGVVLDVPLSNGLQIEGLFTHQQAHVSAPGRPYGPPTTLWRMSVDHWQAGGLQEFDYGQFKPFLTGTLGLTRYAADADSEFRFSLGAGGGVKMFPTPHLGVRLDGRVFATFVDAQGTFLACWPGSCFLALNANIVWQAEFTAGVIVRFR
jgi:hypothetical protein